jgi:hypothetical protein
LGQCLSAAKVTIRLKREKMINSKKVAFANRIRFHITPLSRFYTVTLGVCFQKASTALARNQEAVPLPECPETSLIPQKSSHISTQERVWFQLVVSPMPWTKPSPARQKPIVVDQYFHVSEAPQDTKWGISPG